MSTGTIVAPYVLQDAGAGTDGDQYADSTAIVLDIDSIIVADRFRRDIGDVSDLAKSIVEVGLLNPITVREWHGGYRLVAGERRLTAFKSLGLAEIPARVARDIVDARDALVAERDENTARKPMLPSEATALGMAIEEMERPAAHARMLEGRNQYSEPSGPGTRGHELRPRDIAAEAIGMGEATYRRIKTVINIAQDESEPESVRQIAASAVEAIDAGAPVRGEYDRVSAARKTGEPKLPSKREARTNEIAEWHASMAAKYPTAAHAFEAEGHERHANLASFDQAARTAGAKYQFNGKSYPLHVAKSAERLDRASLSIEAAIGALDLIDYTTITPEQAEEALQRIDRALLNQHIRTLKEISNV